jgi:hypothetical protein
VVALRFSTSSLTAAASVRTIAVPDASFNFIMRHKQKHQVLQKSAPLPNKIRRMFATIL